MAGVTGCDKVYGKLLGMVVLPYETGVCWRVSRDVTKSVANSRAVLSLIAFRNSPNWSSRVVQLPDWKGQQGSRCGRSGKQAGIAGIAGIAGRENGRAGQQVELARVGEVELVSAAGSAGERAFLKVKSGNDVK